MKIEINSKKGLKTNLSIFVDKKTIQKKLDERLAELQSEVSLKGFRPGKVPPSVIKSQFGKAVYGEVIDKILRETSTKALEEKKIKVAGQPKIDLKTFGEGKDLNYTLEVESLPKIELKPFNSYKAIDYKIKLDEKVINEKIREISKQHKHFEDKKENEKSVKGDQIAFDYTATIEGNKFEGSEGKGVVIELGKNLFLKGFDEQLIGLKKNETKNVEAVLPPNHPKKELANKKTKFKCKITNIKKPKETIINDEFAKHMGAKDLPDLKVLIEKQVSSQYQQALDAITKKEILDQIDKFHKIDLPKNLVENELSMITRDLKKEDVEKHKKNNEKIANSRIKLGLVLSEYGEKNNLKVSDDEINLEIQKQVRSMPGQEKLVMDYYKKNPSATQSLKGAIYENKIIKLFKSKMKLDVKTLSSLEAEKVISNFNKAKDNPKIKDEQNQTDQVKSSSKIKTKSKKISKK